jgi:hypothetical protein
MVLRCKAAVREDSFFENAKRRKVFWERRHPACMALRKKGRQGCLRSQPPNNFLVILVLDFSSIRYCAIICHKLLNTSSEVE